MIDATKNEELDVINTAYSIINYNISIPRCNYSKNSRRHLSNHEMHSKYLSHPSWSSSVCIGKPMNSQTTPTTTTTTNNKPIHEQLKQLDGWNNYLEIAIDGQNGTTKSSLAALLNRTYVKVNDLCPDITCGSDYNHRPLKAFDYMAYQMLVCSKNTVWDRCMFSNLIFYYAHHLMYTFGDRPIPNDDGIIWPILNTMAIDTCLLETLTFVNRIKRVPTVFFVCSNVDLICESLRIRGIKSKSWNDIWNSKEYNYQMAQYNAYRWFGKLLNYPVFDLMDFFNENLSIDDMHVLIAAKLNLNKRDEYKASLPESNEFDDFNEIIAKYNDDVMVYEYSRK